MGEQNVHQERFSGRAGRAALLQLEQVIRDNVISIGYDEPPRENGEGADRLDPELPREPDSIAKSLGELARQASEREYAAAA